MHKISKDLQYNDPMQEVKNQKLQEEKAKQGYESEKVQVDVAKKSVEDIATVATNPTTLHDLMTGMLTTPASIKEYPQVKNQPQGWKDLVIRNIIENQYTTAETLYMCWKLRIKPQLNANSVKELEMVDKIFSHANFPPTIIEELSEFLLQNKHISQYYRLIIGNILSYRDNVTPKMLENLYKIYTKTPSLQKQIATHPNAPMDIAINYVLESKNVGKVNDIKNIKAVEFIANLNKSIEGFNKEKVEELVASKETSTEILNIIHNSVLHPFDHNMDFKGEGEEKNFFAKLEDEIKTHPNTPFDNNGNLQILNQGYDNEEFRKQAIIDYYSKYINKSPEINRKILDMLEEFKDSDWEISILYEDLEEKISLESLSKEINPNKTVPVQHVHIPTDAHLKAFWEDPKNKTKKIFFVRKDDNDDKFFNIYSQTSWGYNKGNVWHVEGKNFISAEEAKELGQKMASESPDGIYGY